MVEYTKNDMKILAQMSREGSVAKIYLEELDYDPLEFLKILQKYNLKKDIYYLFELPIEETPLLVNRGDVSGYLQYRLRIAK